MLRVESLFVTHLGVQMIVGRRPIIKQFSLLTPAIYSQFFFDDIQIHTILSTLPQLFQRSHSAISLANNSLIAPAITFPKSVAPRELLTVVSGYGPSCIFYTDGSLTEGCASFAVHQMGVGGFGHKIQSSAGAISLWKRKQATK
jgi:hypothetical protein